MPSKGTCDFENTFQIFACSMLGECVCFLIKSPEVIGIKTEVKLNLYLGR